MTRPRPPNNPSPPLPEPRDDGGGVEWLHMEFFGPFIIGGIAGLLICAAILVPALDKARQASRECITDCRGHESCASD